MFTGKEILRTVVLVAIGVIIALSVSKLFEGGEGGAAQKDMRDIRREEELNEAAKQPKENDDKG